MEESPAVEIILTPIQFAAILENETIEDSETLSNRLWGAATLVGGAVELIGSAALFLIPEPTMVTKVAGGTLGVHGLDTASTGIQQIVSGRTRTTITAQAATALAGAAGVNDGDAAKVGMAIDIAVPFISGFAGAARVIAIRRGTISLNAEEIAGGHTILKHIGKTEKELRDRLLRERRIPAASTFRSLKDAERSVAETIRANKSKIKEWAKDAPVGRAKGFEYDVGKVVGHGVVRKTGKLQDMTKVRVVLKKVSDKNRVYFVLTSYLLP